MGQNRGSPLAPVKSGLNSIDADGTKDGYELHLTRMISDSVDIPVIASGGAGSPQHMYEALTEGKASAALIASIVHYGEYSIKEIKDYISNKGRQRCGWSGKSKKKRGGRAASAHLVS